MKRVLPFAIAMATPALARADKPRREADPVHDLHTTDRLTPVSTVGVSLGYELWDDDAQIDSIIGFDLAGHFVSESGLGGYVVLPLSWVNLDPLIPLEDDDELSLGNVEVGGMYAVMLGRRADLVLHGGVALPTADDDGVGGGFGFLASVPRYGELAQRLPNSTWLRFGLSPMGTAGIMFWRFDAGFDLMIDDDDDTAVEIDPILRVNGALGVDLGPADLSAELVTNILDDDSAEDDDVSHTFAVGARFEADKVQPGVALVLPLDFDDLDQLDAIIAVSLTARVD